MPFQHNFGKLSVLLFLFSSCLVVKYKRHIKILMNIAEDVIVTTVFKYFLCYFFAFVGSFHYFRNYIASFIA